ncbi:SusC/RagA family TonB-linked outer membrane protein [Hymenobacter aerophilus]|uniref:SusC/RagA family TonB-linked outer membrane protein n=1 Tax=Hymenobacter aerophilus TaxID=119644 RepID=UPI00146CF4A9|nr:SusC/RagA family TonB-linked outer membrane protein [Hymenobacter aerophilus]
MVRLLPLSFLLPLALPALAQQPDTLSPRRVAVQVPDSTRGFIKDEFIVSSHLLTSLLPLQEQLRQVAGVQATPYSGAPGTGEVVRIRGAASLSGNAQPLYVVDGVPVFQHTLELDSNPLLSIPTQDIEHVEVFKGAYETALYGSQAVNGVIHIITRRGQAGKPRLNYEGYGGVQRTRYHYDLLNAQEFATLANEVTQRYGQPARFSPAQVAAFGQGTDWQDELLRTAAVQQHHLGLQGGTARTRYHAGADYLGQNGVLLNSRLQRYALRAALDQRVGQHIRLDATASLSQTNERRPLPATLQIGLLALPTQSPTDPPGSPLGFAPIRVAQENYQTPAQRRLLVQTGLHYELSNGLTLGLRGGLERATVRSSSFQQAAGSYPGGLSNDLTATYSQWVLTPSVRYARSFGDQRHVVAAGLEYQHQARRTTEEIRSYLLIQPQFSGTISNRASNAVSFYQLTTDYTFAQRYQLLATLRRDASSSFAETDRQQWLPGVQAVWRVSGEDFWTPVNYSLKVWAGWGRTSGRGLIGRNFAALIVPSSTNLTQQINVLTPDLTTQTDVGMEAGLFDQKLTVTLQGYARNTRHQQYFSSGSKELARIRNKGLELSVGSNWQVGAMQGSSRLAAAINRNRYESEFPAVYLSAYQRASNGQPVSTFYGLRYLGTEAATGQPRFEDANRDGRIDYFDQQPLGNGLPRQLLSFGQQLRLGRFALQLQADGMFGYSVLNTVGLILDAPNGGRSNASARVRNRWTPANPNTDVPAAGASGFYDTSSLVDYVLQAGNHVRLSALSLSYKVWEQEARSVSLWLGGHDLLVLSGYRGFDPNISSAGSDNQQAGLDASTYPTARTVVVGVRATL